MGQEMAWGPGFPLGGVSCAPHLFSVSHLLQHMGHRLTRYFLDDSSSHPEISNFYVMSVPRSSVNV